mmetsp:Transcript_84189/g.191957  ORF Transcript_84189/g.191957 Transcript_84189/m.191957 type:complete len:352 (-) Transcript_84189:143-1198(-)
MAQTALAIPRVSKSATRSSLSFTNFMMEGLGTATLAKAHAKVATSNPEPFRRTSVPTFSNAAKMSGSTCDVVAIAQANAASSWGLNLCNSCTELRTRKRSPAVKHEAEATAHVMLAQSCPRDPDTGNNDAARDTSSVVPGCSGITLEAAQATDARSRGENSPSLGTETRPISASWDLATVPRCETRAHANITKACGDAGRTSQGNRRTSVACKTSPCCTRAVATAQTAFVLITGLVPSKPTASRCPASCSTSSESAPNLTTPANVSAVSLGSNSAGFEHMVSTLLVRGWSFTRSADKDQQQLATSAGRQVLESAWSKKFKSCWNAGKLGHRLPETAAMRCSAVSPVGVSKL